MKRYTLADIGKLAGVSPKTVSRVINNDKYVKDETRKKILKIIDETGYYPNNSARSLVTRKTKTIGLIVGDIENPYYSRLARGVIRAAESYNYSVIVCESRFAGNIFGPLRNAISLCPKLIKYFIASLSP